MYGKQLYHITGISFCDYEMKICFLIFTRSEMSWLNHNSSETLCCILALNITNVMFSAIGNVMYISLTAMLV